MMCKLRVCNNQELETDIVDNRAVPNYSMPWPSKSKLPACSSLNLYCVMEEYHKLFCTTAGYTKDVWHYIPTARKPVNVPPRCIPTHYHADVCQQI